MAAGGALLRELCEEATCPICLQYFHRPVILAGCGHSFCRACLARWAAVATACPQCKKPLGGGGGFSPNRPLANVVEIAQKLEKAGRDGEDRAQRGSCRRHGVPLQLFCRDDQTAICWVCDKSAEHKFHSVVPLEEVGRQYQETLQVQLKSLKKEREHLLKQLNSEELGRQACLALLKEEKKKLRSPFEQIHTFLKEKLDISLAYLRELEKETQKKHKARIATLAAETSHLTDLITEVEVKCQQPPSEFLQDIGSTITRCKWKPVGYTVPLPLQMQEKFRICSQKTSALEAVMNTCKESLESIKRKPTKVNVTLDQDTAHPSLILSNSLKSMMVGDPGTFPPKNPERFDYMHCALGCETFDSGSHWWEVEVTLQQKERAGWALGVARESVRRKGLFIPSPEEGIWAVGKPMNVSPSYLLAFTFPKMLPLTVRQNLRKIRISLKYEEKCVEFFDADTNNVIFVFHSASFSGKKIQPYFWLWKGAELSC